MIEAIPIIQCFGSAARLAFGEHTVALRPTLTPARLYRGSAHGGSGLPFQH
jgi:hypothetical protein